MNRLENSKLVLRNAVRAPKVKSLYIPDLFLDLGLSFSDFWCRRFSYPGKKTIYFGLREYFRHSLGSLDYELAEIDVEHTSRRKVPVKRLSDLCLQAVARINLIELREGFAR